MIALPCLIFTFASLMISASEIDNNLKPIVIDIVYEKTKIKSHSLAIPNIVSEVTSLIDITSYSTWIDSLYVETKMKRYHSSPSTGKYGQNTIYGNISRMAVNFNEQQCDNFPLIIVQAIVGPTPLNANSIIGLGLASYFMTYLQSSNLKAVFTMSFTDSTKGTITLGEIPLMAKQANPLVSYCKVLDNLEKTEWGCQLQFVIIGELKNTIEADKMAVSTKQYSVYKEERAASMIFDSIEHLILCPESFIDFLSHYYFQDATDSNSCSYTTIENINYFVCTKEAIDSLPAITIVIDDYGYTLNAIDLFFDLDSIFVFQIRLNPLSSHQWRLGNLFLRKYTTIFNSENKTIGFFSMNDKVKIDITDEEIKGVSSSLNNKAETNYGLALLLLKMEITLGSFSILFIIIMKLNGPKL